MSSNKETPLEGFTHIVHVGDLKTVRTADLPHTLVDNEPEELPASKMVIEAETTEEENSSNK